MFDNDTKIAELKSEQSKYPMTMTYDEMCERQQKYYEENNITPPTLDEINQYIKEVRERAKK